MLKNMKIYWKQSKSERNITRKGQECGRNVKKCENIVKRIYKALKNVK